MAGDHPAMMDWTGVTADARRRAEQAAGAERILWAGMADPWLMARRAAVVLWVGGPFTLVALLLWLYGHAAAAFGAPAPRVTIPAAVGVPLGLAFLGAGAMMLAMPWHAFRAAKADVYVLTGKRLLHVQPVKTTAYRADGVAQLMRRDGERGAGSLWIRFSSRAGPVDDEDDTLDLRGIPHVAALEAHLRRMSPGCA